jgi:hypothetical protein
MPHLPAGLLLLNGYPTMSRLLTHKPCPRCGSRDNCAEYDDGHEWCFGCNYYKPGKTNLKILHTACPVLAGDSKLFPEDAAYYIPAEPMRWLIQNGITYSTQKQFGIQWSPSQQLVCWKIGTLGWQGRCFSPTKKTKYIGHGKIQEEPTILHPSNFDLKTYTSDLVVLCEDYLSAIRISSFKPALPLFGCTINLETLTRLKQQFDTILVWLDADKLDNARRIAKNATLVGMKSSVIFTEKDPKAYQNHEIEQLLNAQQN